MACTVSLIYGGPSRRIWSAAIVIIRATTVRAMTIRCITRATQGAEAATAGRRLTETVLGGRSARASSRSGEATYSCGSATGSMATPPSIAATPASGAGTTF